MISELVVSASILMLSAAQHLQIPPYHVVQLPNLQPAHLPSPPNTQLFMIQRANTILGEDVGTPLEPGLLTAGQISVSETAQNVLNQESQVVGYNLQNGLPQVMQQQRLPQQFFLPHQGTQFVTVNVPNQVNQGYLPNIPKMIPVTDADAIGDKRAQLGKYRNTPQSLTIPVLNNVDNHHHIVPVPAMASLKTLFGREKQYKDAPYFTFKTKPSARVPSQNAKYTSHSLPRPNPIRSNPHANLYDDIPANHPVPPPSQSHQPQTHSMFYTQETPNLYEERSRSPNHPVPPSQSQTNSLRYSPETTNSYEDKSRSPHYPVPPFQPQRNSIRYSSETNLYEDRSRSPNYPVPPSQPQTNPIRYSSETTNSYEGRSRSPHYPVPTPQSHPNPIRSNPQNTHIYYDIPPNHPVPGPSSDSNRNTFDEISLVQRLKQESSDIPVQSLLLPSKDSAGEYAPARPPPPPEQNSYIQQHKEEEIINMMPPLPYREVYIQENFTGPPPPPLHLQPQPDKDLSAALSTAMKNILPPMSEEESSKEAVPSVEDTATERILTTTYKPKEAAKGEFEKPKKNLPRKSKPRSESKGARASSHPDTETSNSENFYQQAPAFQNNDHSNGGNGGYGYNSESHSSPNRDVVHKHIFVHAAPDSYHSHVPRVRVIRPQYDNEKHVNIIFVKSPTPPPEPQTIVELPPRDQPKTFVYVLSKRPEDKEKENFKIIGPAPSKPLAPEIFFIRYGAHRGNKGYPVPSLQSLYENSGTLSNPQPELVRPPTGLVPPRPPRHGLAYRHKRDKDYGLDVYAPLMSYSRTGQINEITREEADTRSTKLEDFF